MSEGKDLDIRDYPDFLQHLVALPLNFDILLNYKVKMFLNFKKGIKHQSKRPFQLCQGALNTMSQIRPFVCYSQSFLLNNDSKGHSLCSFLNAVLQYCESTPSMWSLCSWKGHCFDLCLLFLVLLAAAELNATVIPVMRLLSGPCRAHRQNK